MENMAITPLNIGQFRFDLADIYNLPPDHPNAGQIEEVPMFSYHIALNGRSILVDAVEYDLEETPAILQIPGYTPPPDLIEQLGSHGIDPAAVTDVIITHAHFDHYGALCIKGKRGYQPAFPNAQHYLNRADWHPAQFDTFDERTLGLVNQHGLLNLIEGNFSLGDSISILLYPGETPGHQILHLEHEGQNYYFGGDLYHHPIEFADVIQNVRWASAAEMQASKANFMKRVAGSGGFAYFTHITGANQVIENKDSKLTWR